MQRPPRTVSCALLHIVSIALLTAHSCLRSTFALLDDFTLAMASSRLAHLRTFNGCSCPTSTADLLPS